MKVAKDSKNDPNLLEKIKKQNQTIRSEQNRLRNSLEEALKANNPEIFLNALKEVTINLNIFEPELVGFLNEYSIKGGYPEIISTPEYERCDRLLQTYINDIIAKDFLGKVRKPESLELLLYILGHNTGRKINVDRICADIEIKKPTYYAYVSALKKICLIYSLDRLPTSLYGKQSGISKMYINDVGLRNSVIRKFGPLILTENTGELLETLVCDHLLRLSFKWNNYIEPQVYYWTNKNDQEVDFVIKTERFGTPYLPVEVKSGDSDKIKGIKSFIKEKNSSFGIVVTKNRLEYTPKDKLVYVPLVYFLLLC